MAKHTFKIDGMHCASCAIRIEGALKDLDGVNDAIVNYALTQATVDSDSDIPDELYKVVKSEGYRIRSESGIGAESSDKNKEVNILKKKIFISSILTIPVFILAMWKIEFGNMFGFPASHLLEAVFTTLVVFGPGISFHKVALQQIKKGRTNMDSLISLGTLTALIFSWWSLMGGGHVYFETAAVIITLILIGRYMENLSKGRASEAISKLLELGVKEAHKILENGDTRDVSIGKLVVGDVVLVKPGEKIPLDGVVVEGSSNVDESMLTGESMSISKALNAKVFGATLNQSGALNVQITAIGGQTALDKIIKLVEEAQQKKAPMQKLVDKIAGVFVPTVVVIAFITFIAWWFATGSIESSLISAVAVLVIACPCALGLATPTAILVGTGSAAKKGVFIKSGEALERGEKIDVIMLDKTGTITKGKPAVIGVEIDGMDERDVLRFAASIESISEHPLAQAIVKKAADEKIQLSKVKEFFSVTGKGISASVDGKSVRVGRAVFIKEVADVDFELQNKASEYEENARTVVYVSVDSKCVGVIVIADEVKEGAKEAIERLHNLGMKTVMITGDNKKTADVIAKMIGISEVHAEVYPVDKMQLVVSAQEEGLRVAFVGDGINDAPALTQADLGIAMGTGTDIAIESGQIVLMGGDPSKIPDSISISRRTFRTIKQNLFWAFIYNIIGIPLAAFGLLNPMIAAGAMAFSSVSVLLNSLRLKKV